MRKFLAVLLSMLLVLSINLSAALAWISDDDIEKEMYGVYSKMSNTDRANVRAARSALQALSNNQGDLLAALGLGDKNSELYKKVFNSTLLSKFDNDADDAADFICEFFTQFAGFYYSSSFTGKLQEISSAIGGDVKKVFGVGMDDVFGFYNQILNQLANQLKGKTFEDVLAMLRDPSSVLRNAISAAENKNSKFTNTLSQNAGIDIETLLQLRGNLVNYSYNGTKVFDQAEKSLITAYLAYKFASTPTTLPGGGSGGGGATTTPPGSTTSEQANQLVKEKLGNLVQDILAGKLSPTEAARKIGEAVKELAGKSVAVDTKKAVLDAANKVLEKAGSLAAADVQTEVKDNKAVVTVETAAIEKQIASVLGAYNELAAQLKDTALADLTGKLAKQVVLNVPAAAAGKELAVQVPGDALTKLQQAGLGLLVKAPGMDVSLPAGMLGGLNLDAGKAVQLAARPVQVNQAPPAVSSAFSTHQVWELDLQVVDKASGQAQTVQSFGQKVRVVLTYDPAKVQDPEILGVYRYNEANRQWDYVGGRVNLKGNTIAFGTGHFSLYGVMAYEKSFADMANHWAKREVAVMAARHIAKGVAADKFAPENRVTRAEFAALLVRLLDLEKPASAAGFVDVQPTDWFSGEVAAAVKAGLVQGVGNNRFAPHEYITREQMAVMLSRAMQYAGIAPVLQSDDVASQLAAFQDKQSIASWAREGAAVMASEGIIKGRTADSFAPQGLTTRAEAAVMLYRFDSKL